MPIDLSKYSSFQTDLTTDLAAAETIVETAQALLTQAQEGYELAVKQRDGLKAALKLMFLISPQD